MATLFSMDNPVFKGFAFYATASVVKMIGFAFLTTKKRFSKNVNLKNNYTTYINSLYI